MAERVTGGTEETLHRLRVEIDRLNRALEAASDADISVELKVDETRVVGRRALIIRLSGRATRSRIELDERL